MVDIDAEATTIDADINLLLLIHPKTVSESLQNAIRAYLARGGALIGFLYQRNIVRGNDFGQWISKFWRSFSTLFTFKSTRVRKVYRSPNPKPKPNQKNVNQEKIDEILDKISQSGYASLTKEEKEFLFRAGNS